MHKEISCTQDQLNRLAARIREHHASSKAGVHTFTHVDTDYTTSMMRYFAPRYTCIIMWDSGEPYSVLCMHYRNGAQITRSLEYRPWAHELP